MDLTIIDAVVYPLSLSLTTELYVLRTLRLASPNLSLSLTTELYALRALRLQQKQVMLLCNNAPNSTSKMNSGCVIAMAKVSNNAHGLRGEGLRGERFG